MTVVLRRHAPTWIKHLHNQRSLQQGIAAQHRWMRKTTSRLTEATQRASKATHRQALYRAGSRSSRQILVATSKKSRSGLDRRRHSGQHGSSHSSCGSLRSSNKRTWASSENVKNDEEQILLVMDSYKKAPARELHFCLSKRCSTSATHVEAAGRRRFGR